VDEDKLQPFSIEWTVASVVLFTAIEILIGGWLGPVMWGRYVSPMLHAKVIMLMHLGSYFCGGILVGIISPRIRMLEPAVAAFVSVALVLVMAFFLPVGFVRLPGLTVIGGPFSLGKLIIGGGIAFGLALLGAYLGEKWMGNVADDPSTARGRLRSRMWDTRLSDSSARGWLTPGSPRDRARRM